MMLENETLAKSGIPSHYWGKDLEWPGSDSDVREDFDSWTKDIDGLYDRAENIVILGTDRTGRMKVASWLAQQVMSQGNKFNREAMGFKHHVEAKLPSGELVTHPFTVKMLDVEGLEDLFKEREKAVDRALRFDQEAADFRETIRHYDFLFITEVGREWANTYFARIIMDVLITRQEAELPTVMTLAKKISTVMDKQSDYVYREVSDFIYKEFAKQVKLK